MKPHPKIEEKLKFDELYAQSILETTQALKAKHRY